MSALPRLPLSRMTVAEFIDWPGDGIGCDCPLPAIYEGTRFLAAG
jgi:hypothetical protein